jgi:hypothetical protein
MIYYKNTPCVGIYMLVSIIITFLGDIFMKKIGFFVFTIVLLSSCAARNNKFISKSVAIIDGAIKVSDVQTYDSGDIALGGNLNFNNIYPFTKNGLDESTIVREWSIDRIFSAPVCQIIDGKLKIYLGTPISSSLIQVTDIGDYTVSDSTAKVFGIYDFLVTNSSKITVDMWLQKDKNNSCWFIYSDKPVKINGTVSININGTDRTRTFNNVSLLQGWNMIIDTNDDNKNHIFENGIPDSGYKWVVYTD